MRILALVALFVLVAAPMNHAEAGQTVEKIRKSGVIHIGNRKDAVPFSYVAGLTGHPMGYTIAICERIVTAIGSRLKLPNIKIQYHPVQKENRVALLTSGMIDMECGATTPDDEKSKDVDFSPITFVAATRVAVHKSANIHRIRDLHGKRVVVARGTNNATAFNQLVSSEKLGVTLIEARDDAASYAAFRQRNADAIVMDDILLLSLIAESGDQGRFEILDDTLARDPYAIMIRRGDAEFKVMLDQATEELFREGAMVRLYQQWFRSPIPPKRVNLALPVTEEMARVLRLLPR